MECHCLSTVGVAHCSRIPSFQGASTIGCNLPSSSPYSLLLPSPLPNSFLQRRLEPVVYQKKLSFQPLRTLKGSIRAEKQGWDVGRFWKTLSFFDQLPSPGKLFAFLIEKISDPSPSKAVKPMDTTGIVLVAGATGGVGRRVVDILRKNGQAVRVLVRNEEKARKMLGEDVDLIVGDITKASTLLPEYFKGVKSVINAVSVIVGPKEGDTPDRAKYSQGIKFFEPEIKGDSPEMVEFIGMKNLISAVKESVGLRSGKLVFGFEDNVSRELPWGALDDVVMGGVSASGFEIDPSGGENGGPAGIFRGFVSTANNGGFASIRTKNFSIPEDLSAYDGLELRIKGDGRRYKFMLRTNRDWDTVAYTTGFDTVKDQWQSVRLPFSSLRPIFRARTVSDAQPFNPSEIISFQLMFSKFEYDGKLNPTFVEGPFQLPISTIRAYIEEPITPRFVHVSSAGVTRPERPGLDLSKQPPAVRMNKELGFILTYKLKGEDLIRESGIPYTIVRPCALTEEPAGADLIFAQGDDITGKISREEVAKICIAALESPYACDKTFEVKSVIPFSEPYTVDPENPPPEKDYDVYFQTLKDGITGKESLEQTPVSV
ncbi:protein HIGH CHLOROPHYLL FLUORESCENCE PHENOTYPE 173, chloroplastic [Salvia hispanica]|uniref:protein HIGH CHLOROPHYLL FLUORESCENCE PHENOTYPE 173, chloroplastic n=1 Tax=Salvia hispanica TaxID=49212 RepID=UPI0020096CF5|nr:protein HIGH CHLOROPHYLL FLUORESCENCE PHENOTYPE 173, chloroplastic [Salvia hispanica]XP_047972295.1 protein HIGH CHLOROPHYLL FLUORESCENCE PHENOTYPE 173, chloroplastic [Salvia hispanica]